MTKAKICGITNLEDATHAEASGADALGFVFYSASPRYIAPGKASEICAQLAPFTTTVGLFVDAPEDVVRLAVEQVKLQLLQFHGDESPNYCRQFSLPYIKAIRVRQREDVIKAEADYQDALALLVDAYKPGVPGGTGECFDWSLLPEGLTKPLILAGGLNPENVRSAIESIQPYAVDVSGGVEREKGLKDHAKVSRFLKEVSRGG